MREKINTIDFDNNNKELVSKILSKIWDCNNLFSCKCQLSQHKGVSISLECRVNCDLCRFVFDDELRYEMDLCRKDRHKNIIWDKKEILNLSERKRYVY